MQRNKGLKGKLEKKGEAFWYPWKRWFKKREKFWVFQERKSEKTSDIAISKLGFLT